MFGIFQQSIFPDTLIIQYIDNSYAYSAYTGKAIRKLRLFLPITPSTSPCFTSSLMLFNAQTYSAFRWLSGVDIRWLSGAEVSRSHRFEFDDAFRQEPFVFIRIQRYVFFFFGCIWWISGRRTSILNHQDTNTPRITKFCGVNWCLGALVAIISKILNHLNTKTLRITKFFGVTWCFGALVAKNSGIFTTPTYQFH